MFLINFILYAHIIFKIRANSVQLEARKRIESTNRINDEEWTCKYFTPPSNIGNMNSTSPVISSAKPVQYYTPHGKQSLDVSSSLLESNSVHEELSMEPFHFRLSHITFQDIEEYSKFLQSQSRTAAYYVSKY